MTATDADVEGDSETDRTERLRSVYLSVTDGEAEPTVETQREEATTRELREERAEEAVGPAELHGLDDAIDDPDPSNAPS
ncbi:hypothetical protein CHINAEXTREME_16640 [Halobiforma lacisalsi AJ5]|uniref:Uncharacterized protein n=1 Tax=Natronobacterium lacisalsi AJ5 TaxID=358396 RepID=M0LEK4_NATLA|nr:hypothetical protein [Halobiforma lacisalsi]APW99298.1 hypothetical protein CHINAEXTREME_16640 [Halobiforma lacisalsi AJ5]EMA30874.1 hypothetical protein C445_16256 [Halobiforma lacisalsi AJ5]